MTTQTLAPTPTAHGGTEVASIPFARLLRVEWGKSTDTRAARWLLAIVGLATVAVMLAPLVAVGTIDQDYLTYLTFSAVGLSVLLPVVSILTLSSEWSQRTVLTTFTQEPRRERVIAAKVAACAMLAGLATVFGCAVTAVTLGIAAACGRDLDANLVPLDVLYFFGFVLLNMMMGVAFGALLHNTAAAIVLFFTLPTAFSIAGEALTSVGEWLDPTKTFDWVSSGEWGGHTAKIVTSVLVWVLIPLGAGVVRTVRREIK